jgi:hypothetical protein
MHPLVFFIQMQRRNREVMYALQGWKAAAIQNSCRGQGSQGGRFITLFFVVLLQIGCFGLWSLSWIPFQVLGKVEDGVLGQPTLVELGGILEEWLENSECVGDF